MLLFFFSCINQTLHFQRVMLDIDIEASDDGAFTLSAHHAWRGEGELRYPAAEFDSMVSDGSEITWELDVPTLDNTEGLLIYAWQDRDNDGVLCALDGEEEYAGIAKVADFPVFEATLEITLEHACMGPELLYAELEED